MKKNVFYLFLVILIGIFSLDIVSAGVAISVDSYYPTPAEAGDYFNIIFKITNTGASDIDAVIKFKESYPFSLDPGEQEEIIINNLGAKSFVTRRFKIRVDSGAREGDNPLIFQYKDCLGCIWMEKSIPIIVMEAQTMFDVVLQELNSEGVFIAIANIGKNPANAVTVRIPEQENFATQLISASIVGNLISGDYTLVGFKIIPKNEHQRDPTDRETTISKEKELKVQIDYTDPLGNRRMVLKSIMLNPSSLNQMRLGDVSNMRMGRQQSNFFSFLKNFWFWISVILVLVMMRKIIYKKLKRR